MIYLQTTEVYKFENKTSDVTVCLILDLDIVNFILIYLSCTRGIIEYLAYTVDPGGPVVIILATGSEVRGFKPGWGPWIF